MSDGETGGMARPGRNSDMLQRRYLEPSWVISRVVNPLLLWLGVVPTLWVRGRKTGRWRNVPVNVLELDGERYLVAPRGETDWVRNLRAAGSGQLQYGRRGTEAFRAVEVPDKEKPRVIEAYLDRWGNQVRSQFEALPDPTSPCFSNRTRPGLRHVGILLRHAVHRQQCYSGRTSLQYGRNRIRGFCR